MKKGKNMNLILWRHADAHPGSSDLARELSKKGERQAAAMATWLKAFLPEQAKIPCSPARRTRQTADALGLPYEVCDDLSPDTDEEKILRVCDWPGEADTDSEEKTIVVVGHQPSLGRVGALLMTQAANDWTLRKGGVWWFGNRGREGDNEVILKAAMSP